MKIMIMGSGGVGGYFGARLAAAGSDVTFIARGAHLAAIRDHGLQVESLLGNTEVRPAKVTGDPAGVGTADVIFLAVKLWDTEDAVRGIRPAVGPQTAVISFQNGVLKDDVLRSVLGSAPVMDRGKLDLTDAEFAAVSSDIPPIPLNADARLAMSGYMERQFTKMLTS